MSKEVERKVCANCQKPWKTGEKQCSCGCSKSIWAKQVPGQGEQVQKVEPIVRA